MKPYYIRVIIIRPFQKLFCGISRTETMLIKHHRFQRMEIDISWFTYSNCILFAVIRDITFTAKRYLGFYVLSSYYFFVWNISLYSTTLSLTHWERIKSSNLSHNWYFSISRYAPKSLSRHIRYFVHFRSILKSHQSIHPYNEAVHTLTV